MESIEGIKVVDLTKRVTKHTCNIGILCLPGLQNFLPDIVYRLEEKYNVRTYYDGNADGAKDVIEWSDLVWFEWANEMLVYCSNTYKDLLENKKVLVRLHSYEALSGYCRQVNWSVVDEVIFVANHIREIVKKMVPTFDSLVVSHVVHNGVDVNKFRRFQ